MSIDFPAKDLSRLSGVIAKRWNASQLGFGEGGTGTHVTSSGPSPHLRERVPYESDEFERDVQRMLDMALPFSSLPGVQIFSPLRRGEFDWGAEIDHLLHIRFGTKDFLVVIETKMQRIDVSDDGWWVSYNQKSKNCRAQIERQIRTLDEYLRPISPRTELRFIGLVVSVDPDTQPVDYIGYRNTKIFLCPLAGMIQWLWAAFNLNWNEERAPGTVLRVSQSPLLEPLRWGIPLPALGHPEVNSAVAYVNRCRRSLDVSIFSDYVPSPSRWAINGSAGMGKSVLLAYTAAVFCSGYKLGEFQGDVFPVKATADLAKIGLEADERLSVGILAMSAKQLENLRQWFQFFVDRFLETDSSGLVRFRKPEFILVRSLAELENRKWAALLVDECHDIPEAAEEALVKAHLSREFYLVVACDRHQKLALSQGKARILNGLDFSRRTRRLKQNYRNPAPVNIASLALMFRWFGNGGPKVVPVLQQLREQFGFEVEGKRHLGYTLSMQTDAHPGSAWCHTVGEFQDAATAFRHLVDARLPQSDVLWVRFSAEDEEFSYEELGRRFIYHVCRSTDAKLISDKYIKGQDYPVVVIEGFPGFMDRWTTPEEEARMWSFRRELYLCASRATCFLYLVTNMADTPAAASIKREIRALTAALSVPRNAKLRGSRLWSFGLEPAEIVRDLDVFADVDQEEAPEWELWVWGPTSVRELAAEIEVKPHELIKKLLDRSVFANLDTLLDVPVMESLVAQYGGQLRVHPEEMVAVG